MQLTLSLVAGSWETGNESLMKSFVLHLFCEQGLLNLSMLGVWFLGVWVHNCACLAFQCFKVAVMNHPSCDPMWQEPSIPTYTNNPSLTPFADPMPTPYSNILCWAQQHQIQVLGHSWLIKSNHHLDIASHETNATPHQPCTPVSNTGTTTLKNTSAYCSSTCQDSFPLPWHHLLTIIANSDSDSFHLLSPSPLYSIPRPCFPCSLTLYHCYPSPFPFTDYILHELYKYVSHVPVFLILDVKVVSVSFSHLSHLSYPLASLTSLPQLQQYFWTQLALSSLATTTTANAKLST